MGPGLKKIIRASDRLIALPREATIELVETPTGAAAEDLNGGPCLLRFRCQHGKALVEPVNVSDPAGKHCISRGE